MTCMFMTWNYIPYIKLKIYGDVSIVFYEERKAQLPKKKKRKEKECPQVKKKINSSNNSA